MTKVGRLIERLIAEGLVNKAKMRGDGRTYERTPLHWAALYGHVEAVRALLAAGASIHMRDEFYATALGAAVKGGSLEIVRMLIAAGADVKWREERGLETALHSAVSRQDVKIEVVRALIAGGSEVNVINRIGQTPLITAGWGSRLDIMQELIQAGADPRLGVSRRLQKDEDTEEADIEEADTEEADEGTTAFVRIRKGFEGKSGESYIDALELSPSGLEVVSRHPGVDLAGLLLGFMMPPEHRPRVWSEPVREEALLFFGAGTAVDALPVSNISPGPSSPSSSSSAIPVAAQDKCCTIS